MGHSAKFPKILRKLRTFKSPSCCFLLEKGGGGKSYCSPECLTLMLSPQFRYCLDDQKALERDGGFSELQSRLIRYETQTTCTRDSFPVPTVLSPLPSPAILSEPRSVPDGEALQSELRTEVSGLKRRSKDPSCHYPQKR